jgi:DNA helicase-2/ATP-dependent DNA helicase PcrA
MASGSDEDVEEERRLCYVAITRARERLLLSHARFRRVQGSYAPARPSRFLDEIPSRLLNRSGAAEPGFFDMPPAQQREWGGGSSATRAVARPAVAAARAKPRPTAERFGDGLDVGRLVRHPAFGSGLIVDREGSGRNTKLTIDFSRHGKKKILPAYTKLETEV